MGGDVDYALVFRWIKPVAGREAKALEVLADVRTFFGKLFAEDRIGEPFVLTNVNDGLMIVRGEMTKLFEVTNTDEFILLMDKAMFVAEGFRFDGYFIGDAMAHRLALYAEAGKELAYF
jgi:hypothetical protein